MAEKGLISKSTLTAIADAIRAKGSASAAMLPGEMADLISAIETSNAKALTGTFTPSGSSVYSVSLGKTLDLSGNYCLIIIRTDNSAQSGVQAGYTSSWNGTKRHRTTDTQGGVTTSWTIATDGSITVPKNNVNNTQWGNLTSGASYAWLFLTC